MAKVRSTKKNRYANFKGRTNMRKSRFDWDRIKADYVSGQLSRKELARKWGCSVASLDSQIGKGAWVAARDTFRREIAEKLQTTMVDEVLQKKREAIRMIYGLKLQVVQKLQQRLQRGYLPTVKELEILQRLELDMRSPGWNRAPGEHDGQTVNVVLHIETIIDQLNRERVEALEALTIEGGMNPDTAGFLYGGEGEIENQDGTSRNVREADP